MWGQTLLKMQSQSSEEPGVQTSLHSTLHGRSRAQQAVKDQMFPTQRSPVRVLVQDM